MNNEQQLTALKAQHTHNEIAQQPEVWQLFKQQFATIEPQLKQFLQPILSAPHLNIILTGAGTSAYIGKTLDAYLNAQKTVAQQQFKAIATTDIVSNPHLYLPKNQPTLLVSFARSGDSPESIASVNLANQCCDDIYHLIITCNEQGALHQQAKNCNKSYSLLLPAQCNDQSFAMTSSFTTMTLAALCIFAPCPQSLATSIELSRQLLSQQRLNANSAQIQQLAAREFNKVVFIGSGPLAATAQEAALKMLELSAGKIQSYFETVLGFRHGPKSVVDRQTMVIMLNSQQPYQQKYQQDLYQELIDDQQSPFVYQIDKLLPNMHCMLADVWLSFPYIVYCQTLAFYKALALGISPDNPCPSGEVNRVVKGVTIYPYSQ